MADSKRKRAKVWLGEHSRRRGGYYANYDRYPDVRLRPHVTPVAVKMEAVLTIGLSKYRKQKALKQEAMVGICELNAWDPLRYIRYGDRRYNNMSMLWTLIKRSAALNIPNNVLFPLWRGTIPKIWENITNTLCRPIAFCYFVRIAPALRKYDNTKSKEFLNHSLDGMELLFQSAQVIDDTNDEILYMGKPYAAAVQLHLYDSDVPIVMS